MRISSAATSARRGAEPVRAELVRRPARARRARGTRARPRASGRRHRAESARSPARRQRVRRGRERERRGPAAAVQQVAAPEQAVGRVVVQEAGADQRRTRAALRAGFRSRRARRGRLVAPLDSTRPLAASLYRRHRPRTFADVVGQEHVVRTPEQRARAGSRPPRVPVRGLARHRQDVHGEDPGGFAELPERRADGHAVRQVRVLRLDRRPRRRWTSWRWTRPPTTRSTTSATCASASPTRRSAAATRSTSSTRRTCSRRRRGTRSSRRSRSRRRTRSSCSRRPRPTRSCRRSSTAATASTSAARRCRRSRTVLRRVADAESIAIPDEAVALVARSATGSFRDALGTLEQLLAYSGSTIALDDVLAVLGAADADLHLRRRRRGVRRRRALRAARRRPAGRVRPRPRPLLRRPRGPRPRA